jgi:hypothetical protein
MRLRSWLLLLPLLIITPLHAQSLEGEYLKVDYLSIGSDEENEFLNQTREKWKEMQIERIEKEEISNWRLYKVKFPGSWQNNYNYVSVTSAKSMSAFENSEFNDSDLSMAVSQNPSMRPINSITHSELWRVRNSVIKEGNSEPSLYMIKDYMDVPLGREYEYQMFEDEIARPLHEDRMDLDRMNAWEVYELIIPGGLNYGYNFSTGNFYNKLEHIEFGFTDELIRANHPDVNLMEFFETIFSTRDLVKSELWVLIDFLKE